MGIPESTAEYLLEERDGISIYISKRLEIQDKGFSLIQAGIFVKRIEVEGIRII
ncbi:MAG: hypothetical protein RBT15_02840 [Gudongella sp.]|nr:hypothetical protein [Gudongella sp.]